jgi:hypothetical protein
VSTASGGSPTGGTGVDGDTARHPADSPHLVDVTGYRTLRQVALTGSFERGTSVGLDIAHPWRA